ncbi:Putative Tungsten formylmethanofuran dehydrogenase, subunit E [Methanothrix harundinacea 6Ac]|uniref:Putative Tungsten formylmethanofuran dehydrogenase, subunit E n=2 Tax=Methanothrix harundinacea TaxID=301375 RepID=G7WKY8_METH6|nr:Putative Tungsten formylmethanofuran dehydrogenase, subunit E [Methanothrix harundinacea 6Ac]
MGRVFATMGEYLSVLTAATDGIIEGCSRTSWRKQNTRLEHTNGEYQSKKYMYLHRYVDADIMAAGILKMMTLHFMKEGEVSGYDIMKKVESLTGEKPSTGSVYPLLKKMEREGWISGRTKDGKTCYSLTEVGKEHVAQIKEAKCGFIKNIYQSIALANETFDDAELQALMEDMHNLHRGFHPPDGQGRTGSVSSNSDIDALEKARIERLKLNPREEFVQAVLDNDLARCLLKTAEIHGHFCPGSALGVMASAYGLNRLGMESISSDGLENLMAVVEINACFADGVQAVSGCTLGNNALVYRDLGRLAVTFAVRGRDTGVRVRVLPDFREKVAEAAPEFYPLMEKVIKDRAGDKKDAASFRETGREAAFALIELPFEELFAIETVRPDLPDYAPITESVICPGCGEMIMATKVIAEGDGRGLCFSCAGGEYRQVEGRGIVGRCYYD